MSIFPLVDVAEFVARCLVCQKVKIEHQRPGGLQPLPILTWKLESVSMDFVVSLPTCNGLNAIWVIVDRLSKVARFIPMKMTWSMERLAEAYTQGIIRLHGVLREIISDRDPRFHVTRNLGPEKFAVINIILFIPSQKDPFIWTVLIFISKLGR